MVATRWKVEIPQSSATVDVYVIDTTTFFRNTSGDILINPVYPGYEQLSYPSYSFLIHHKPSDARILFDLGLRANYKTHLSPELLKGAEPLNLTIEVEKDVADILTENGLPLQDIQYIVLSHHHWDHTGDVSKFPPSTTILVGPGYKEKYCPGWPADPKCFMTTSDTYAGRETIEVDFSTQNSKVFMVGTYPGYDFFGDGSFYILNTTGHTVGHLCALCRTTSIDGTSTFMFLGGDIAHHGSLFRPTEYLPLPEIIAPSPDPVKESTPGDIYASIHRVRKEAGGKDKSFVTPLCCCPSGYVHEDPPAAQKAMDKMQMFDADDDILVVCAHDATLLDVMDFYPKSANDWRAKHWGKMAHWKFLGPLVT
jgi:glyoxylase-like metal-dependent hydrolase (beta-lactamase superfamily II)